MLALAAAAVIPWIPAAPPPATVPPAAPACRLSQLRVGGADPRSGVFYNGATGSLVGSVTFRNVGTPCSLLGRPRVRFVCGPAPTVRQREVVLTGEEPAPDVLPPPFSVRALPHGRTASVGIWWSNWCAAGNPGAGNSSTPPAGVEVTLPSGGTARLTVTTAPRCDAPQDSSTVSVGTFQPVVAQPARASQLPLTVSLDRREYRVAAGGTLRFQVVVANTGTKPFSFAHCPLYYEELAGSSYHEIHVLNCRPMGSLPPGGRAVFAMELHVPKVTPRAYGVDWELGLGTFQPPSAIARVIVTP